MTHITYAHIMIRKKLFLFLIIISLSSIFSEDNILIITTKNDTYNELKPLLENINSNDQIDLILVEDDFQNSNFTNSLNYLSQDFITPPSLCFYIDKNIENPAIYGFNHLKNPPLTIIKILLKELKLEKKISKEFPLYLTGLIKQPEIIKFYSEYEIPLIILTGNINSNTIIKILEDKIEISKDITHYFIFNLFEETYYLQETFLIYFIGILLFSIILLLNFFSKRAKFHLRNNKKYFWTIPLKICAVFVFYYIATLVIEFVVKLSGNTDFVLSFPKTFFIIKQLIIFFIYGISFHIIKDSAFSKSPHFYSHASFYCSIILFLMSCTIYLPLGLYFIWQILITIIFIISESRESKRFLILLNPVIIILVFFSFLSQEYIQFTNLIITSRYLGNIYLTILIIPYIFLQESFYRFNHRSQNIITHTKDIILSLLTITITITLIAIILELK